MGIKKDYLNKSVDIIMKMDPSLDREKVTSIVSNRIKQSLKDPRLILENNIKLQKEKTTVTEFCNWLDKRKPVISGNATFYVQHDELLSPTVIMLINKKKGRSLVKKELFKAIMEGNEDKARILDLDQSNKKVIMNAEYGGSGAPSAAFYNKYTPSATTLMAQAIITSLAAFFEDYLGDNQKFFHINELFDWINAIKIEKLDDWISIPSREETTRRLKSKFFMYSTEYDIVIEDYVRNCSEKELVYLFYANNMRELFRRHSNLSSLLRDILVTLPLHEASLKEVPELHKNEFKNVKEYNQWVSSAMFMNPYSPPKEIEGFLNKIIDSLMKYCYVQFLTPDSIIKLNNHKRNTVLLVDTDSNVINADLFVKFVLDELFTGETFGRKPIYNEIICINILAGILARGVDSLLDFYGECHNINKEYRKELSMKNEFMFRRLLLMEEKKRYASSIVLREGTMLLPFKTDIKGMDFIKAGVTDEVTERFTKILQNRILFSDELELKDLMKDLKEFEKEIYQDLSHGGTRFLKPQSYKPEEAYKVVNNKSIAWQIPAFRAVTVWNILYPQNKIYSLDRVKLVKLIVTGPEDLISIKETYPRQYSEIMDKIFKSNNLEIAKAGLKIIAIPSTLKEVPEWIIPLMDYQTIISDVMRSFRSIVKAFKVEELNLKTPNGAAKKFSGFISI